MRTVTAGYVVIATGTEVTRDASIPFDGRRIFCSDDVMRHRLLPFVDAEIIDTLAYHLREDRVTLRLGCRISTPSETLLAFRASPRR